MNYVSRLGLAREPFSNSPDPGFLYHSKQHRDCLQQVEIAVRLRRGLNIVLGDIGTGKTTLCRTFLLGMGTGDDTSVHLLLDPPSRSQRFFLHVLYGIFTGREADRRLNEWQLKEGIKKALFRQCVEEGKLVVLIIDEGQKLSKGCLEILRELLNYETNSSKLLQIVIFAQRELEPVLSRMPNLLDRVNCMHRLHPLDREDSEAMIRFRVAQAAKDPLNPPRLFSSGACKAIYRAAGGYPRRMVRLCHKCLIEALVRDERMVGGSIVRSVVRQERREGTLPARRSFGPMARAAGLAAVLIGSVLVAGLILGPGLRDRLMGRETASVRMEVSRPSATSGNISVAPGTAQSAEQTGKPEGESPVALPSDQNANTNNAATDNATTDHAATDNAATDNAASENVLSEGAEPASSGADSPLGTDLSPETDVSPETDSTLETGTDAGQDKPVAAPKLADPKQSDPEPAGKSLVDRLLAFFSPAKKKPANEDPERYASDIVIPDTSRTDLPAGADASAPAGDDSRESSTGQGSQQAAISGEGAQGADVSSEASGSGAAVDSAGEQNDGVTVFQTSSGAKDQPGVAARGGAGQVEAAQADGTLSGAAQSATGDDALQHARSEDARPESAAKPKQAADGTGADMPADPAVAGKHAETSATGEAVGTDVAMAAGDSEEVSSQTEVGAPADMPENLGQMKMPRGYSLSSVLRRVYGIYSGDLLRTFKEANPRVRNVNNIPVGRQLVMPLAGPDVPDEFHKLVWVSLKREPSLQKAFDRLREYIETGWPIRLLCTISEGQVAYRVVLSEASTDREGAMGVLGALPPSLQQGAEIFEPGRDVHFVGWLDKASRELAEKR